jgi:cell division protein FtsX
MFSNFDDVVGQSNVVCKNNGNGNITLQLLIDRMHICNFSLQIKTTKGVEEVKWERKFYTYQLLQIPSDAESIIVKPLEGESLEFLIIVSLEITGINT